MRAAVTKNSRRRTFAVTALMLATAAGATVVGIAAASAAEPAHFVAVFVPTPTDPGVAGNGIAASYNEAESLARNGLADLCRQAGYFTVEPGIQSNAAAAASGQSMTPDGNVLYAAFGRCTK